MSRSRILIADDHAPTREELARLLAAHEHEVVAVVGDGRSAVEAAVRLAPDLALLDISMPEMSGIMAARRLRQSAHPVRIIFVTGHADPAYVEAAFELGAAGYVLKTHLDVELPEAIRQVLAGGTYRSPQLG